MKIPVKTILMVVVAVGLMCAWSTPASAQCPCGDTCTVSAYGGMCELIHPSMRWYPKYPLADDGTGICEPKDGSPEIVTSCRLRIDGKGVNFDGKDIFTINYPYSKPKAFYGVLILGRETTWENAKEMRNPFCREECGYLDDPRCTTYQRCPVQEDGSRYANVFRRAKVTGNLIYGVVAGGCGGGEYLSIDGTDYGINNDGGTFNFIDIRNVARDGFITLASNHSNKFSNIKVDGAMSAMRIKADGHVHNIDATNIDVGVYLDTGKVSVTEDEGFAERLGGPSIIARADAVTGHTPWGLEEGKAELGVSAEGVQSAVKLTNASGLVDEKLKTRGKVTTEKKKGQYSLKLCGAVLGKDQEAEVIIQNFGSSKDEQKISTLIEKNPGGPSHWEGSQIDSGYVYPKKTFMKLAEADKSVAVSVVTGFLRAKTSDVDRYDMEMSKGLSEDGVIKKNNLPHIIFSVSDAVAAQGNQSWLALNTTVRSVMERGEPLDFTVGMSPDPLEIQIRANIGEKEFRFSPSAPPLKEEEQDARKALTDKLAKATLAEVGGMITTFKVIAASDMTAVQGEMVKGDGRKLTARLKRTVSDLPMNIQDTALLGVIGGANATSFGNKSLAMWRGTSLDGEFTNVDTNDKVPFGVDESALFTRETYKAITELLVESCVKEFRISPATTYPDNMILEMLIEDEWYALLLVQPDTFPPELELQAFLEEHCVEKDPAILLAKLIDDTIAEQIKSGKSLEKMVYNAREAYLRANTPNYVEVSNKLDAYCNAAEAQGVNPQLILDAQAIIVVIQAL